MRADIRSEELRLNRNEVPASMVRPHFRRYRLYPDSDQMALREAAAEAFNWDPQGIVAGNGSDELIDLVQRIFLEPGDSIVVCPPTFGMYSEAATRNRLRVREVPLDQDFDLQVNGLLSAASGGRTMLFLADPNNPTGNRYSVARLQELIPAYPGLVVIDEAYVEFSARDRVEWLADFPNLIILRTLSKAWGLAGARVGFALAAPELVNRIHAFRMPYNMGVAASEPAVRSLGDRSGLALRVARIVEARETLAAELLKLSSTLRVYPSEANFLLVRFRNHLRLKSALEREAVLLRDRSYLPGLEGCLRITVGSPPENRRLLDSIMRFELDTALTDKASNK